MFLSLIHIWFLWRNIWVGYRDWRRDSWALVKVTHEEIDSTMKTYGKSWKFLISEITLQKTEVDSSFRWGYLNRMPGCLTSTQMTGWLRRFDILDKNYTWSGSIDEVNLFPLGPKMAILLFPNERRFCIFTKSKVLLLMCVKS